MKKIFKNTNICWFCEKEILDMQSNEDQRFFGGKVRDHCVLTGKYRGPAHYQLQY